MREFGERFEDDMVITEDGALRELADLEAGVNAMLHTARAMACLLTLVLVACEAPPKGPPQVVVAGETLESPGGRTAR